MNSRPRMIVSGNRENWLAADRSFEGSVGTGTLHRQLKEMVQKSDFRARSGGGDLHVPAAFVIQSLVSAVRSTMLQKVPHLGTNYLHSKKLQLASLARKNWACILPEL